MWKQLFTIGALAACAAGCTVQSNDPTPVVVTNDPTVPAQGTLTMEWTISGSTDPSRCNQSVVNSFQITIEFENGASAGTYQQACGTFATSIPLAAGRYRAQAELVDAAGQPRTTSIDVVPFTIVGGDELHVPVDFPADSFF